MLKHPFYLCLAFALLAGCTTYEPGAIVKISGPTQAKQNQPVTLDVWSQGTTSGQYTLNDVRLEVNQEAKTVTAIATLRKGSSFGQKYPQMIGNAEKRQVSFVPQSVGSYHVQASNFTNVSWAVETLPLEERTATPTATIDIQVLPS